MALLNIGEGRQGGYVRRSQKHRVRQVTVTTKGRKSDERWHPTVIDFVDALTNIPYMEG